MPSKRVNDMVPKRSIRDISKKDILPPKRVASKVNRVSRATAATIVKTPEIDSIIGGPTVRDKVKPYAVETRFANAPTKSTASKSKYRIFIYSAIAFLVLVVVGMIYFTYNSSATISIKPKSINIPVDMIFTAKKNPTAAIEIPYEVVNLTETASSTVEGVEGGFIQNKSKGVITLYNNATTGQSLANNTRIENSKGLIYRLSKAVVIPGKKTVAGKAIAGSIDVVAIADQPGDVYNSKVVDLNGDFKITGFKGTAKYTTVFGRQKTDIIGGYVGRDWKIAPEVASSTLLTLRSNILTNLNSAFAKSVPSDYVTFPDNVSVTYSNPEYIPKGNGRVSIKLTGSLSGAIISKKDIANLVISKQQNKYSLELFSPENIQNLAYTPITKNFSAKNEQNLIFKLTGNMILQGVIMDKELISKLVGKNISDSKTVFASYPSIASADVILKPRWVNSLPDKVDRLKINIVK